MMNNKALVVIDIQNDITKHYRDIIGNINAAIEWAMAERLQLEKKRKRMRKHAHRLYQA